MAKELKQFAEFYNLDALIARDIPQPLQEGEITIAGLRHRAGIGHEAAKRTIEKWEAEGVIEPVGKRRNKNRIVDAWRLKGKE